jgi:predicted Zn-dependent protease with MMP-like domain
VARYGATGKCGWYNHCIMQSFTLFPRAEFESLVAQALDELPPYFQAKMSNVEVVIEPWPTRDALQLAGVPAGQTLFPLVCWWNRIVG